MSDVAVLSSIPASIVVEVRLLRASSSARSGSATQANGDVVVRDVLVVRTRGH
jgi:hypothetical protein